MVPISSNYIGLFQAKSSKRWEPITQATGLLAPPIWCQYICNHDDEGERLVPQCNVLSCLPLGPSMCRTLTLQWRHNEHDGVSNDQPHDCLLNRLFRRRSKKTSKHKGPVTRKMFPFDDIIMSPRWWSPGWVIRYSQMVQKHNTCPLWAIGF